LSVVDSVALDSKLNRALFAREISRRGGEDASFGTTPRERLMTLRSASSGGATALVIHPFANERGAGGNTKITIFAIHQVQERGAIEFFQMRQAEHGP
jgi:hypothetical protein